MNNKLELLAPVGSMEALEAAVMNGADAVYLGGKLFNARQYASNFEYEELMEAVSYAHLRGVSVFVTVNILLDDKEISDALDYVKYLYEIGIDGIIVQDIGFASSVREIFPELQIHASTQMTINNLEGALHLEKIGFTRVVLAREVPYKEILRIKKNSDIELEVFIHGALCFSYSGQCLMSSLIGGRSGNRGTCAQPCRMEYNMIDAKGKIAGNLDKGHYLSTRDLNTLDEIGKLINAGVKSFKIEGRMKRPEYVATVVSAYRKVIDCGSDSLTQGERVNVEQIFNREFTKGHTFGDFGNDFVSVERPDNRGRVIGKVIASDKNKIQVLLSENVNIGDGLEWDTYHKDRSGTKAQFSGQKGEKIWIGRIKDPAPEGSPLRKTSSAELLENAKKSYINNDKNLPLSMKIRLKIGEKPILNVAFMEFSETATGDNVVETAEKSPISVERISEQLAKLGNTVFSMDSLEIDMDDNSFITVKGINTLRRNAVERLSGKVVSGFEKESIIDYKYKKASAMSFNKLLKDKKMLTVRVSSQKQFDQINLKKVDRVYLGFNESLKDNINILKNNNIEAFYWSDKILYKDDLEILESTINTSLTLLDGVSASNIGTVEFLKNKFSLTIHGDIGLNVFNSYTLDYFRKIGVNGLTLSPELNLGQIREITDRTGGGVEAIVYGYLPVMISRNCPMAYLKGCKDDSGCKRCSYANGYMLKDRMNKNFRMVRGEGFTTIFNSVPVMVLDRLEEVSRAGITSFRLDFTFEDDVRGIQELYYDYLNGIIDKNTVVNFVNDYKAKTEVTNGHFFRGVL
ncbi:DUF3656 domain-containing U32 family peptidase [Gudongella sp. DL1XJH-153]|uniref:DUF3656 domain-containing U32 family peptidase n=1 Tax=Gudongella sp. DL1XJH-153 TaxID=3409804 RepID=UPI003BB75393